MRADKIYDAMAVALAVLLPLSLTLVQWERERTRMELEARAEFEFRVRETTEAVRARMLAYEQVLRGAAALFSTSGAVTREAWRDYVRLLQVSQKFPGIPAIVYAPLVTADGLDEFIARTRRFDISNYTVWPEAKRALVAPTLYIEPFNDRNLRALGFDLYSEPVRRGTLDIARDTGEATLSSGITLVQDGPGVPQSGIAMYIPVYRRGTEPVTPDQRRAALSGFVGGSIRMDDLVANLLGNRYRLELQIFDAGRGASTSALSQKFARTDAASATPQFVAETQLDLNGQHWTLRFGSTPEYERMIDSDRPRLVLISGLLLSAVLIALIWSLASTRYRALKLAREMTAELRAKQHALRESEERLGLALQGSDLALFDWDLNVGTIQLSEAWATMLGDAPHATVVSIDELSRLVHPDDLPLLRQELKTALRSETGAYRVEHRVRKRGGEWIWILSRAKVVERNADGRAMRMTGTNSDVTARKLVEQMKNEFVGTVSHELRTPLTVIVGALGLLKAELPGLTPDQTMMLTMACDNSARLQLLVNDILDFEKISSGAVRFDIQPLALGPFLTRALELNRVYAERFKVRYELHGPLPAVAVLADAERLMQVMTNLLSNAAKFSPEDATVTLSAMRAGGWVRVAVSDCGPGVPVEFRDRIFEKFAQADSSNARQKSGTGLGLSICKAIIEKLGGHIGYESEFGRGATFYFELPLNADAV